MALGTQTIEELWQSFKTSNPSGHNEITVEGLRKVMQSLGHEPTDEELRHILFDADATGSITFEKFVALAAGEFLKRTYDSTPI
jgi:Ca2+-binding EF-hand superfamily protein